MANNSPPDDAWQEAQRNYWAQWARIAGMSAESGETGAEAVGDPAGAIFEQWWQALGPSTPPLARELLEKMMAQGKQLFRMAERFACQQSTPTGRLDWAAAVEQTFSDLRDIFTGISGVMHPLPTEGPGVLDAEGAREYLQRLFAFPGLGLGHQWVVLQRELIARLLAYQQARQAYEVFFVDLGQQAVSRLQERLSELEAAGETLGSARELYDLWVSVCEAVYAEQAMTEDYVKLYGTLINSQMALKQQLRLLLDDGFSAMGLPSSADYRALEQRVHEDRQAIKALRLELSALRAKPKKASAGKPKPRSKTAQRSK